MSIEAEASSSIAQVLDPERERTMNEEIEKTAEKVAEVDFKTPKGLSLGIETEYYLLDENNRPVTEEQRDEVIGKGEQFEFDNDYIDHELGASMVEIASEPVEDLTELEELEEELRKTENILEQRADEKGFKLARHGANVAQDVNNIERTSEGKYTAVPNAYGQMRVEDQELKFSNDLDAERMTESFGAIDSIDPRNEELPANICSTQLNIQADSMADALEKANIGYAVAPYITALAGNSRFVDGKDLGYNDTRMELWEKAFDIGNLEKDDQDIGTINEFFQSFEDIKNRVLEQPRIVNDTEREGITEEYAEKAEDIPLDVGQGMFWKDSRIKAVKTVKDEEGLREEPVDELLVEFRQNSTQPSLVEDIAVHAFYIGRIIYEQEVEDGKYIGSEPEGLPEPEKVNKNRYRAMRNGLDPKLYDWNGEERDASEVLAEELEKAERGLEAGGVEDPGYLEILEQRLERGVTPSDKVAEEYYSNLLEEFGYDPDVSVSCPEELPENLDYGSIPEEIKREASVEAVNAVSMRKEKPKEVSTR